MDLEILQDYLVESRELLERAQEDTLRLEAEPGHQESLASIFRAFHTIKGGAGFLEAAHLVEWAHGLEELLDRLRSRSLPVTSAHIDAILKGIDVIAGMFQELAEEREPGPGPAELGRIIRSLATPEAAAQVQPAPLLTAAAVAEPDGAEETDAFEDAGPSRPVHEQTEAFFEEQGGAAAGPGPAIEMPSQAAPRAAAKGAEVVESSLRVDANRLDAVMNQVGELVLLRNRLTSAVASFSKDDENMSRIAREMDLRVSDLQGTVMRLRMQPCKRLSAAAAGGSRHLPPARQRRAAGDCRRRRGDRQDRGRRLVRSDDPPGAQLSRSRH